MAGRKNSTFKSILVALLSVCAVIQTGMLWLDGSSGHNFFYYIKEKSLFEINEYIKCTDTALNIAATECSEKPKSSMT